MRLCNSHKFSTFFSSWILLFTTCCCPSHHPAFFLLNDPIPVLCQYSQFSEASLNLAASGYHDLPNTHRLTSSMTSSMRTESTSWWRLYLGYIMNSFFHCPRCVASVNPITILLQSFVSNIPTVFLLSPLDLLLSCEGNNSLALRTPHLSGILSTLQTKTSHVYLLPSPGFPEPPSNCQQWFHLWDT